MRVYIAGALSSKERTGRDPSQVVVDYLDNVNRMCKVAALVRRRGYFPYVPALDILLGVVNGNWGEVMYRDLGMAFLEVCDAMLVISESWGVEQERKVADSLSIPVVYSVDELDEL